jgi:transcription termination factor NusG
MGWSLAQVQPNRELSIARALTRHEFPNHVFKVKKQSVSRGRHVDHMRPAYPGYIFLVVGNAWQTLRERFGITRYVHRDLPPGIVPALVSTADTNDVLPIVDMPSMRFSHGERVRVQGTTSLLSGQIGIFQHLVNETDAIVLLPWLGRWVPTLLDERDLVSLIEHPNKSESSKRGRKWRRRKGGKQGMRQAARDLAN